VLLLYPFETVQKLTVKGKGLQQLALFTELPSPLILGKLVSGIRNSRKLVCIHPSTILRTCAIWAYAGGMSDQEDIFAVGMRGAHERL